MSSILEASQTRFAPKAAESTAQDAAEQLEAFFMRRMLAEMRNTVGEGMLGGGYAGKMFQDMLDDAMAEELAGSGGLGIADLVGSELEERPGKVAAVDAMAISPRAAISGYQSAGPSLRNLPVEARLSSDFGGRIHPVTGERSFHEGVDLAAAKGAPVSASGPGVVVRAEKAGSYGNLVVLDHGGGLETRYAHLDSIDVEVGEQVAAGESLGTVGSTGRATGPHLHFEVRRGGKAVNPKAEFSNLEKSHHHPKGSPHSVDR